MLLCIMSLSSTPARCAPSRAASPGEHATQDAGLILARPLFAKDRRPPPQPRGSAAASAETLPRLSGIVVTASYRRAIFDRQGHPAACREGDRIGPYTILAIAGQQVTLAGPDGRRVVGLSFDSNRPGSGFASVTPPSPSIMDRLNSHVPYRPVMPKMPTSEEFIARMTQQAQQAQQPTN